MDDIKAKQQIVEKIKDSTNILITVSKDPSVDALSAALGLTLLFDKLEKHPTSIFSGEVPPAIAFLEPEKTFDTTTDSLRDFIIALDKEKADHLRYKVEGDSVKIFITPYKTTITSDDLEYSQGDYNVELVIALGVDKQDNLDDALDAHGQILHDADIITMTAGDQTSDLGGIDWHDDQASSLSEMVAGLAEALKTDKKKSLLDATIATAFLTGIVAETDRFSNTHTTSRVMTTAAQLMAAGADQQLIATKLEESREVEEEKSDDTDEPEETPDEPEEEAPKPKDKSVLSITHDEGETLEEMDKRVKQAEEEEAFAAANAALSEHEATAANEAANEAAHAQEPETAAFIETPVESQVEPTLEPVVETLPEPIPETAVEPASVPTPTPTPTEPAPAIPVIPEPIAAASAYAPAPEPTLGDQLVPTAVAPVEPVIQPATAPQETEAPSFGGTLNATTEQAADDARREEENDQNKAILSHSYLAGSPDAAASAPTENSEGSFATDSAQPAAGSAYAPEGESQPAANPADPTQIPTMGHELVIQPPADMLAPAPGPVDLGLPMPPSLPDFGAQPAVSSAYAFQPTPVTSPEILGDILAPDPSTGVQNPFGAPSAQQPFGPPTPPSNDPGQFKIPGQQ